jgi:hypothetical protein
VFNNDRLNDEYDLHQRRFAHMIQDELDFLVADARVVRPRWYNRMLAQTGDGLITAGRSIKKLNAGVNSKNLSVSMR